MMRVLVLSCVLAAPAGALAQGIRIFDHDAFATARGNAFAATADNPSALYYNPAGISQLHGHNVRGGLYTFSPSSDFDPDLTGGTYETKDEYIPLPGMFYVFAPTNLPFSFGAAYYLPFGLSVEWPGNAPFGNTPTEAEFAHHTFSGVASWQVLPSLSMAIGPTFNYGNAKLSSRNGFSFKGDDTAFGGVAGILWRPFAQHSFGLSYRTASRMDFSGRSRATSAAPRQHGSVAFDFPQVIIGGYSFRPTTNWNIEVNLDWTDWDDVGTLRLEQGSGDVRLPLRWQSSWAIAAGATRYLQNGLRLSGGYVYVEDSTSERTFHPIVPEQDLHVFSGGVGGDIERFSWDVTYQFTWGPGRSVSGSAYGPSVSGEYAYHAHAVSLSLGWAF